MLCFSISLQQKEVNIVIDQGNSLTKVAVFEKYTMVTQQSYTHFGETELAPFFKNYPIEHGIYSTVTASQPQFLDYLSLNIPDVIKFSSTTPLPISLGYRTPNTLGLDRIAAVVGAQMERPEGCSLVIDAGTAITYDLLEEGKTFVGGNIAPGLHMRFKALNTFTQRLPLVEAEGELPQLGIDTQTAIRAGVINGMVYEIEGYISHLREKWPHLFVFLTGGDGFLLATKLKSTIFADKNLVQKGLNRILIYNV